MYIYSAQCFIMLKVGTSIDLYNRVQSLIAGSSSVIKVKILGLGDCYLVMKIIFPPYRHHINFLLISIFLAPNTFNRAFRYGKYL